MRGDHVTGTRRAPQKAAWCWTLGRIVSVLINQVLDRMRATGAMRRGHPSALDGRAGLDPDGELQALGPRAGSQHESGVTCGPCAPVPSAAAAHLPQGACLLSVHGLCGPREPACHDPQSAGAHARCSELVFRSRATLPPFSQGTRGKVWACPCWSELETGASDIESRSWMGLNTLQHTGSPPHPARTQSPGSTARALSASDP